MQLGHDILTARQSETPREIMPVSLSMDQKLWPDRSEVGYGTLVRKGVDLRYLLKFLADGF